MTIPWYQCGDTVVEAMQWPCGEGYADVCKRATIHRWVWDNARSRFAVWTVNGPTISRTSRCCGTREHARNVLLHQ